MRSFADVFGGPSEATAHAPGRVNLLGEHTDYNDGYVLPTTIPQFTKVEIARAADHRYRFYSANLNRLKNHSAGDPSPRGFAKYPHGCIEVLRKRGASITPVVIHVHSDVPIGSGLSSSAALEVAVLRALRMLFKLNFDDVELALLAQQAEIEYAGVQCGILDQMACSLGDPNHMLFLDTRTLERRLLRLPLDAALMVIDSGVPRSLATSAYNQRRSECEAAAALLGVKKLREVTDVAAIAALPELLKRRARHVITENNRVLTAAQNVTAQEFGSLMNESHASLRDDYDVSIEPLDHLVHLLQRESAVYGARLTGAGFGGACVALVKPDAAAVVGQKVMAAYNASGQRGTILV